MVSKLSFNINNIELIDENPDSSFSILSLDFFASGINKHDMYVSENTLFENADTIKNVPLVWKYDPRLDDAYTHDPEEIACGFVPEKFEITAKKLDDGRTMLSVLAFVWKRFSGRLLEFFQRDGEKPVSVEMSVYNTSKRTDGLVELLKYKFEAITILGSFVTPAIPMAKAIVLQFAEDYKHALAVEFGRYDDVDFMIPNSVKNNAQKGLDLHKEYNVGGGSTSKSSANYLLKNEKASPERIRIMRGRLNSQKKKDVNDQIPPSHNYVNWMMYGGNDGFDWCNQVYSKLEELDTKKISYFSDLVTFPYTSKEDMNPALKGIDPPISVAQGNGIARQAESIGSDDKKNGWAIAIANFKKTHKVVDNKWVSKKEEMSVTIDEKDLNQEFSEEEKKDDDAQKEEMAEVQKEEMAETPEEEKEEDPKEEEKETPEEEKKEEFSLTPYLDVQTTLAFLEKRTENYEAVAAEFSKPYAEMDYGKVMGAMYSAMCKMAAQMAEEEEKSKTYMAENEELKKFKAEQEQKEFDFAVDLALKEIEEKTKIPSDEIDLLKEKSKEYSLETFDAWKNFAKARGLDFAAKEENEGNIKRYAVPFQSELRKNSNSPWKR